MLLLWAAVAALPCLAVSASVPAGEPPPREPAPAAYAQPDVLADDIGTGEEKSRSVDAPEGAWPDAGQQLEESPEPAAEEEEERIRRRRRTAAPAPALESVEERPSAWRPQDLPKPQFVTKRGYRGGSGGVAGPADSGVRTNEIALPERSYGFVSRGYADEYRRPDAAYYDRPAPPPAPPRRVIYYADLPEIVRPRGPANEPPVDRYRPLPERGYERGYERYSRAYKFPRDGPYGDAQPRPAPSYGRDDWYPYRDGGRSGGGGGGAAGSVPPGYAIIDAERGPPPPGGPPPYPGSRQYPDPDPMTRYNRIPAPYQRTAAPPPQAPPPYEQYRPSSPAGGPPARLTVAGPARFDEPYRDYNPRQPAPWSMQIGTSLTVKDENRGGAYSPGRRFYVQSQQDQSPYQPPRYARVQDDPRHRI